MINNFFNWFRNKTIFYKKYYYIKLNSLLKKIESNNYLVVEFVSSKSENPHHFPNAMQMLKTHYENFINVVENKKIIVINNGTIASRFYYDYLTKMGYKCYILNNGYK